MLDLLGEPARGVISSLATSTEPVGTLDMIKRIADAMLVEAAWAKAGWMVQVEARD
eukprot:CAMPEP_0203960948 /NCGR_PEP_ID=MMETSP0359-20131031/91506_1 /ASSEMBLY_ACC=CAM_ASM_000338 /TAXON_ID=268821 /ORGANISM="Scrippsiella Hangoei, Strain SHTV-5" /LENGTH=55 /DNA_ID=CAMNT_0050895517 /DNA_START=389 /DNA_END=554 /DNA_ORIENTATION=+